MGVCQPCSSCKRKTNRIVERIQEDSLAFDGDAIVPPKAVGWHPTIDPSLYSRTLEAIHVVSERLREPDTVAAAILGARQQFRHFRWRPASISCGFASLALFFLYLARSFPESSWVEAARQYVRLAAEATHDQPLMLPGVFDGSSGLAMVLSLLSHDDTRYDKTCTALNTNIALQVQSMQWRREPEVAAHDYDVITGASGILAYLITIDTPDTLVLDAIHKLITYLVWLASTNDEHERKRWYIPPTLFPVEEYHDSYPNGYFNCGLAHGIPGPLAALALAWHAGYQLPGQREAILSLSRWLVEHQVCDEWGINWPSVIALDRANSADANSTVLPTGAAWCYGTPGVARSLWLAGKALNDSTLCQVAVNAIEVVLQRPIAQWNIHSSTLCHGVTGLLVICLRFAHETYNPMILQHISPLVKLVLEYFNPNLPLGFRDEVGNGISVDDPGLLTGASGVALALLAASTSCSPDWDRAFLIS